MLCVRVLCVLWLCHDSTFAPMYVCVCSLSAHMCCCVCVLFVVHLLHRCDYVRLCVGHCACVCVYSECILLRRVYAMFVIVALNVFDCHQYLSL